MNGLADIYKEMSRIVIEQGTVMDRIDENIFETRYQAHVAKEEVEKSMASETSARANGCIVCLV